MPAPRFPALSQSKISGQPYLHPGLLLLWIAIGAMIRFSQLAAKPPWTDEFATLVFSLGQSFKPVLLDQAIALETLLQPLRLETMGTAQDVWHHLLTEDVHPPLYFLLSHAWLRLFSNPESGPLVSIELARSLPALLGVAAIPALYGLSWLLLRSPVASHLTAALMAVSPYGVYLAQEARHYTLGILWVIASLCCLVVAVQRMERHAPLPLWLAGLWIGVNGLGIATHYFFILTLGAMTLALAGLAFSQMRQSRSLKSAPWRRIYLVMIGTAIAGAVWLPILRDLRSREITQWIQSDQPFNWLDLVNPLVQSIAAWTTMLVLLPIESDQLAVAIVAGIVMLGFIVWVVPRLYRGLRAAASAPASGLSVRVMMGVVLGAIALFFFIAYGLRTDITRGARYSFVYFPAVILLLGTSLAALWTLDSSRSGSGSSGSGSSGSGFSGLSSGQRAVVGILLVSCLSGLTVVHNLGYRKYYRPDLLVPLIQARSQNPVLIATTHYTLVQTGEIMGIGWQWRSPQAPPQTPPQFLLAQEQQNPCEQNCASTATLQKALAQVKTPVDLWLINFHAPPLLDPARCQLDSEPRPYVSGYSYQLYRCAATSP